MSFNTNQSLNFLDVDLSCFNMTNFTGGTCTTNYNTNGYTNNLVNFNNSNNNLTSTNYLFNSNPNLSTHSDLNSPNNSLGANTSNCADIINNGSNYISQSMDPIILLDNYKKEQQLHDLSPISLPKSPSSTQNSNSTHTIRGIQAQKFLFKENQDMSHNSHSSAATPSLSTSSLSLPLTSEHSFNSNMSNNSSPYRTSSSNMHLSNFQTAQFKSQPANFNNRPSTASNVHAKYAANQISHRSSLPTNLKPSLNPTMPLNSTTSLFSNQKPIEQHHIDDQLALNSTPDDSPSSARQPPPLCEFSTAKSMFGDDFHASIDPNLAISPSISHKNEMETNELSHHKNDHHHPHHHQLDPFQIDDYNLATPTEIEPMLQHTTHLAQDDKSPSQYTDDQQQKMLPSPPTPSAHKPVKPAQHMNKQMQYNAQIQSYLGSFSQNTAVYNGQMSMNTPGPANGFLSRSNSQPDLTINLEKLLPMPNSYNYNSYYQNQGSNVPNSSASSSNGNNYYFINQNGNVNNYNGCGSVSNGFGGSNNAAGYYATNPNQTVITINNKAKQIRRHPSLSYKTSMSECHEENEDYFSNFNLTDYLNANNANNFNSDQFGSGLNSSNTNSLNLANNYNPNGMSIDTCSSHNLNMSSSGSTTSGVSSLATTNATDDGLFLGIDAINDFLSKSGTYSDLFEDLPDLEDLMSLVTFETSSSVSTSSAPPCQPIKQTQCDLNLPNVANNLIDCNPMSNFYGYDYGVDMNSLMMDNNVSNDPSSKSDEANVERTTRSAPPSPTPQRKKQRPTNLPWHKAWYVLLLLAIFIF